ncbi:MAG TPA: hypothetical protein VFZ58_00045 [Candidatus Saccharimonadales bacterium]
MIQNFVLTLLADYNCGAYGASAYGQQCVAASGTDGLAGTGYNIIIPVAFGLALVIAAAIWVAKVMLRRRQAQK